MNRRMMVGCAMLAMLAMLAGCGEAAASSASSEVSATSVSSEASQAIGLAEQAAEQAAAEPELSHEESFYTDHAVGFDNYYLPAYDDPQTIAETDKFAFFEYFVFTEALYQSGEDFYNAERMVFEIPVAEIQTVLERYLGVSFDPDAAFANQTYDAELQYGYDSESGRYLTPNFGSYSSTDYMALSTGRTANEDGTVTMTFACYYLPEDNLEYKSKTMTFRENPDDPEDYQILQNIDAYTVDGQPVTVTNPEEYDQLRPYLESEPWFR